MKICFYSPYIPKHAGGGEKHLLDVALVAAKKHQVVIAIPEEKESDIPEIVSKYEEFMGTSLSDIQFVKAPLQNGTILKKLVWTAGFDALYYVTDGSLFFSLARKNYLHIQIPLQLDKSSIIERLKLKNWSHINTNSEFTKKVIEKSWHVHVDTVLYPQVQVPKKLIKEKDKVILHVGRFFKHLHAKRQDILVDIFRRLTERHPKVTKGWKLILVGQVEDQKYFEELQAQAKGLPIEFVPNATHSQLEEYYKKAAVYWHATGFDVDEEKNPEKVEHFGITTVEAMAHSVVPVVLAKGGQPEILGELGTELSWSTREQCLTITAELLKNKQYYQTIQQAAFKRAFLFDSTLFVAKVEELFS